MTTHSPEAMRKSADNIDANHPGWWKEAQMLRQGADAIEKLAMYAAGWKVVPDKVTAEQRLAMAKADDESGDRYRLMGEAMLAAAPEMGR